MQEALTNGAVIEQSVFMPFAPQKIACGFYHSAAISNSHPDPSKISTPELYAWGRNKYCIINTPANTKHKPGVAPEEDQTKPVKVSNLAGSGDHVYEVSCGTYHMVMLVKNDRQNGGKLWSSGLGTRGRLGWRKAGLADQVEEAWWSENGPQKVKFTKPALRVVCGSDHTLVYATDGFLYAWGANSEGQCGVALNHADDIRDPQRVDLSADKEITHFAAGGEHSLAVLGEDGELWAWGSGRNGRLGLGNSEGTRLPLQVGSLQSVVFVACGEAHSGCIDSSGAVMMWGTGSYGRLGHGEEIDVYVPKEVFSFQEMAVNSDEKFRLRRIALGGFHTLFLEDVNADPKSRGPQPTRLLSCGAGAATGLFAEGATHERVQVPKFVQYSKHSNSMDKRVVQISAGMYHSMILLKSGDIIAWGVGSNGRLCDDKMRTMWEPTDVAHFKGFNSFRPRRDLKEKLQDKEGGQVVTIGMHFKHPTERRTDGEGAADGYGNAKSWVIKQFSCGALHTLALTHGGKLYATGCNANGQLGMGYNIKYLPQAQKIRMATPVRMVAAGYDHCLAVTFSHELFSWGKGTSGQLGTTYSRDEYDPQRVAVPYPVVFCAAGEEHSAVIGKPRSKEEPTRLWTFGAADSGMLGLGEECQAGTRSAPSEVVFAPGSFDKIRGTSVYGPVFVSCGSTHTMVIVGPSDGEDALYKEQGEPARPELKLKVQGEKKPKRLLYSFGSGWHGKLGVDNIDNAYSPKQVLPSQGQATFDPRQVSCGAHHTCVVTYNHELWAWGRGRSIAEPSMDFLSRPRKFPHIDSPTIIYVACCESHTLALTDAGFVWAWGDNRSGQLAVSGYSSTLELTSAQQVQLEAGNVVKLATGTAHTVALFASNRVQGWGDQRCGRLGLDVPATEAIVHKASDLEAVWSSIEERGADVKDGRKAGDSDSESEKGEDQFDTAAAPGGVAGAAGAAGAGAAAGGGEDEVATDSSKELREQKVTAFSTIQSLIKQEPDYHQEHNLLEKEHRLEEDLKKIIEDILLLPQREKELKLLQGDFESSLQNNLKWMPKLKAPMAGDFQIHKTVAATLPTYEKLLWLLQQQVSYLAELSVCIQDNEEHCKVFYRAVRDIYGEPHKRTADLFESFLRLVLDKETERGVGGLYSPESNSRAFELFKNFALSERFYAEVIHPLVKYGRNSADKNLAPSLVDELKTTMDEGGQYVIFALSKADYLSKQQNDEEINANREQELEAEFNASREHFKLFVEGPLMKTIKGMQLPDDIKRILNHVKLSVQNRPLSNSSSEELTRLEPLLTLFVQGIIRPVLDDLDWFGSSRCYVQSNKKALGIELQEAMRGNMKTISAFLGKMIAGSGDGGFDLKKEKMYEQAAKMVRIQLLKWLKHQAETVEDNLEIELMMDTYEAHYDRQRHPVTIATSDLLRLSNMLKQHMTKLRIKESDPLEEHCTHLPTWSEEFIVANFDQKKENNTRRNFILDTRFLFTYNPFVKGEEFGLEVCKSSKCPLPKRLVGQALCEGLIRSHQEHPDDPQKVLEKLFRALEEPVTSTDFHSMGKEFESLREVYKHKNPPDFRMVHALQDGLRVIEELGNVEARPEEVLEMMKYALVARSKQYAYLRNIERGITQIFHLSKEYDERIADQKKELQQALDFSLSLQMPQLILNQVPAGKSLAFQDLAAKKQQAFNPADLMRIGCTPVPMESYSVHHLRKRGAITKVHPPYTSMESNMRVTLRAPREGGVEIVVNVAQRQGSLVSKVTARVFGGAKPSESTVKRLNIQETQMQELMRGDKEEEVKLFNTGEDDKPFFTCKAGAFVQVVKELQSKIA